MWWERQGEEGEIRIRRRPFLGKLTGGGMGREEAKEEEKEEEEHEEKDKEEEEQEKEEEVFFHVKSNYQSASLRP